MSPKPWSLAETHCPFCGRKKATDHDHASHDKGEENGDVCDSGHWCEELGDGRLAGLPLGTKAALEIRRLDEQLATAREMLLAIDVEAAHIGIYSNNEVRSRIGRLIFDLRVALVGEPKSLEAITTPERGD